MQRTPQSRVAPPRLCPYDPEGTARCPFSQPTRPDLERRSDIHCRFFSLEASPDGIRAICRRPPDDTA